ncbi:hypothetical protein FWF93_00155 [Candidatus Saccharibacteria bacterium]|nr:hypothetical protein [Candidatus Saccharibacteria bacterium]
MKKIRIIASAMLVSVMMLGVVALPSKIASAVSTEIDINGLTTVAQITSAVQGKLDSATSGDSVTVVNTGTPYDNANAVLHLNIPTDVTLIWDLDYSGGTFTGSLVNLTGDGAFILTDSGSLTRSGGGVVLLCSGTNASATIHGSISAQTGSAIQYSGTNSSVIIDGGIVSSTSTGALQSVISTGSSGTLGSSVVVKNGGQVLSQASGGYAILAYGDVEVDSGAVISAFDGGVGINAINAGSTVTVNGGTVSTTGGPSTAAVGGSAIRGNNVIINDGVVSATTGKAILATVVGASVTVNGGLVRATTGYAIRSAVNLAINVNGGAVFAYGTSMLDVIDRAFSTTDGVVVAWDEGAGVTEYDYGSSDDLVWSPMAADVTWGNNGFSGGIDYLKDSNSGFIPLDVTVKSPAADIVEVLSPANATITEQTITASVENSVSSLVLDVIVSPAATWQTCADAACLTPLGNMLLAVGENTAYIKVIAENGNVKIYTVVITRAAAATNSEPNIGVGLPNTGAGLSSGLSISIASRLVLALAALSVAALIITFTARRCFFEK